MKSTGASIVALIVILSVISQRSAFSEQVWDQEAKLQNFANDLGFDPQGYGETVAINDEGQVVAVSADRSVAGEVGYGGPGSDAVHLYLLSNPTAPAEVITGDALSIENDVSGGFGAAVGLRYVGVQSNKQIVDLHIGDPAFDTDSNHNLYSERNGAVVVVRLNISSTSIDSFSNQSGFSRGDTLQFSNFGHQSFQASIKNLE
jgi:hypothetical protein